MAIVRLTAYALPIPQMLGIGKHAYVTSSGGHRYSCFGRSEGGRRLVSGFGHDTLAHCYAATDNYAGIYYGVTGVCHQAANRIMASTNRTVIGSPNFWCSNFVFTTYGLPWDSEAFGRTKEPWVADWIECLDRCSNHHSMPLPKPPAQPSRLVKNGMYFAAARRRVRQVARDYSAGGIKHALIENFYTEEVRHQIHSLLLPKRARRNQGFILKKGVELYEARVELTKAYVAEEIPESEFFEGLEVIVESAMNQIREGVAPGDYVDLFDLSLFERIRLFDPEFRSIAEHFQQPVVDEESHPVSG